MEWQFKTTFCYALFLGSEKHKCLKNVEMSSVALVKYL